MTAAIPVSPSVVPPGQQLLARSVNAARLVAHLAQVGYLRAPADRHFFYAATEMARMGNLTLDQLLTDQAHQVAELRWVCYHVLEKNGINWASIAARFNKSKDSVRVGARRVAQALQSPQHFAGLVGYHRQLSESFTTYLNAA